MADWNKPQIADDQVDIIDLLKKRDENVAKMFDGTTHTNIPVDTKRYNSNENRFEEWDGSAWNPISYLDVDVDTVDGEEASGFASAVGSSTDRIAKNADKLDGNEASDFLGANAQAVDSDQLDGYDESRFLHRVASASNASRTMSGNLIFSGANINLQGNQLIINGASDYPHRLQPDGSGKGIRLRALSSALSSGEQIFAVQGKDGINRLKVEYDGRVESVQPFASDAGAEQNDELPNWGQVQTYVEQNSSQSGKKVFTSDTTWSVPAGVNTLLVTVVAGGGGGGGGGDRDPWLYGGAGGDGGDSSFGSFVTVSGGSGGGGGGPSSVGSGASAKSLLQDGGISGYHATGGDGGASIHDIRPNGGQYGDDGEAGELGSGGGGGGGIHGGYAGGGGGSGDAVICRKISVTPEDSINVTVGSGGAKGTGGPDGGPGGDGIVIVQW